MVLIIREHKKHHRWEREEGCEHCVERDRYFRELFKEGEYARLDSEPAPSGK